MPAPQGAYVLRDALFTVEGTDYANQCTSVVMTPTQETQTLKTMVPDGAVQDVDSATWVLNINGIQDYVAARGLARYISDNSGLQLDIVFEPKKGGVTATATVVGKRIPFGGEQGAFTVFDIELPMIGEPVFDPS